MITATCFRYAASSKQAASRSWPKRGDHVRVSLRQVAQRPALVGGAQRIALHDRVGILAREAAFIHQRGQQAARGVQAEAALDVLAHPLRPDDQAVDQAAEADQHVVQQDRRCRAARPAPPTSG